MPMLGNPVRIFQQTLLALTGVALYDNTDTLAVIWHHLISAPDLSLHSA